MSLLYFKQVDHRVGVPFWNVKRINASDKWGGLITPLSVAISISSIILREWREELKYCTEKVEQIWSKGHRFKNMSAKVGWARLSISTEKQKADKHKHRQICTPTPKHTLWLFLHDCRSTPGAGGRGQMVPSRWEGKMWARLISREGKVCACVSPCVSLCFCVFLCAYSTVCPCAHVFAYCACVRAWVGGWVRGRVWHSCSTAPNDLKCYRIWTEVWNAHTEQLYSSIQKSPQKPLSLMSYYLSLFAWYKMWYHVPI